VTIESAFAKTVLEKLRHQVFVVRQRGDVVSQIARRQYTEFPSQLTRTAAVIGYCHNRGQISGFCFQRSKHCRESGSTAKRHHLEAVLMKAMFVLHVDECAALTPRKWSQDRAVKFQNCHANDGKAHE